jgi:hypothetical protein
VPGGLFPESLQADQERALIPVFALAVAIVAAVSNPSSAADLILAGLAVRAFVAARANCARAGRMPRGICKRLLADPVERDLDARRDQRQVPMRPWLDREAPGPRLVDERPDFACLGAGWHHRDFVATQQRDRRAEQAEDDCEAFVHAKRIPARRACSWTQ